MSFKLRLPPLPSVPDLLQLYRIRARKQLSQNFLLNEKLTNKIVSFLGDINGSTIIEVGPGPGSITRSIIKGQPERLIVVEKDRRFKPTLEMLAESFSCVGGKMNIIYDDIRRANFSTFFNYHHKAPWDGECPNLFMIGNLPFSVSTPLIIKWLDAISQRSGIWAMGRVRMCLTFQKEVAERIVAEPNGEQRCRLSVMAQAWTKPKYCYTIRGKSFIPQPDVDVGVVTFEPLITPRTNHDFKLFEKITRHMFSLRRKFSIHCVRTLFPPDFEDDLSALMLNLADLEHTLKSHELSVEDIDRLCTAYKYIIEKHPQVADYNYRASKKVISRKKTGDVVVSELSDELESELSNNDSLDNELSPKMMNDSVVS